MTKDKYQDVQDFLLLNGFSKPTNDYIYTNDKCTITIMDENHEHFNKFNDSPYYCIEFKAFPEADEYFGYYTNNLVIYHLIGFLTYKGLMDKNYKQL